MTYEDDPKQHPLTTDDTSVHVPCAKVPCPHFDVALSAVIDHLLVIEDHQLAIADHQLTIAEHLTTVKTLVEEWLP